jgi:tetratricopeptide (TPR) repeat protein/tRNA A-37 threonylcarbamoyl transferase component Bud32
MSSGAADLNLLFGIMAVQNDFVSRDALIEAMGAWVLDKSKTLGEILVERGALTSEHHALLTSLVAAHVRLHHDDPQQGLAALESDSSLSQGLSQILDPEVQASLAVIGSDELLSTAPDPHATKPEERAPGHEPTTKEECTLPGMRYRILRPHAKGGLGEVFVAEDTELHREVALKEIQPEHLDDAASRGRFLFEAEVTGRLEHPGVVPVYGLGRYADGRPYYAMRFIHGDNLKEAIRRFHEAESSSRDPGERRLALRELLGRFVDVCNAVAYAHSRGVVHRDLKPANIMLGKYGETLVVDWGLAKAVGSRQQTEGSEAGAETTLRTTTGGLAATQMGSIIGTPAYMSPEQAAGRLDKIGPASDIYSLGATLFALLTSRAPFAGENRPAVLRKVQIGDFSAPRSENSSVPRALNAVCLKAMAVKPEDRYTSAGALAADLEHWLGDEPVAAYQEPLQERARRWARRHKPVVAGLAALVAALLVLGGGGATWLYQQHAAAEREARTSLDEARQALAGEQYPRAQAAAERAAGRLASGGSAALRQEAEQLLADVAMVRRMEDARLAGRQVEWKGDFDWEGRDRALADAFSAYGLNVEVLNTEEAAQRIAGSAIQAQLVAGLDSWADARERTKQGESERLRAVANRADGDPWRARLRELLGRPDLVTLEALASQENALAQQPATLELLAMDLVKAGADSAAVSLLRKAQERHPGDFWLNHDLGLRLAKLKPPRPEEAVRYLTAALALRSDSSMVRVDLGYALHRKGDLEGAIRCYSTAIEINPENFQAYNNMGSVLFDKNDLQGAIRCLRIAIDLAPKSARLHYNLGWVLRNKGDLDEAIRCFQTATEIDPKHALAQMNLGDLLRDKGDLDGAIHCFRTVVAMDPKDATTQNNLGCLLKDKGDLDGAIRCLRAAIEINPKDAVPQFNLGQAFVAGGDLERAIGCYRKAIEIDPNFASAHNDLGAALFAKNDLEGAIREWRTAIRINPKDFRAHNNLGAALNAKKDVDGALRCFRAAIEIEPKFAGPHMNLGDLLMNRRDFEGAIRCFRAALDIDPKDAMVHRQLGNALSAKGDLEGAIRSYRTALEINPKLAEVHYDLGHALYGKKDLEGAIRSYRSTIEIEPKHARAHTNLGIALHDKGDLEGAINCYHTALKIDPKLPNAHNGLGVVLSEKGDLEGAIRCWRSAIEINPKYGMAHENLGMALAAKNDLEGAIRCWRNAIEINPKNALTHENLGVALYARKDLEGAIRCFRTAIEINPKNAKVHVALGYPLLDQGHFAEARAANQKALQLLQPKHPLYDAASKQLGVCENFLTLDAKLPAVLKGEAKPANVNEQLGLAKLCQVYKKLYSAGARFYGEAFTAEPKRADDLGSQDRYNAACAAALAGCGQGEDAAKLDEKERASLRRKALSWLQADLTQYAQLVDKSDKKVLAVVQERMQHRLEDPDFAGVRGDALAKLPEAERQEWQKLWDDVESLRKRAAEKK